MENTTMTNVSVLEAIELVNTAKGAQKILSTFSQEKIDDIVRSMAIAAQKAAKELAQMAVEETGFGKKEDKEIKNLFAARDLYDAIRNEKTVGILGTDPLRHSMDVAVPMGVIAGLIPSTNPTSTTIFKALIAIKTGNTIVFSPHPSAKNSILRTCEILIQAAEEAGAPRGIISCMTQLSLEGTQELMQNRGVALILATGGEAMVRAAYSSGNPAIGVGPGNCPAFIDKSADFRKAVEKIFSSKTFDNGVICASEQSIVVEESSKEGVMSEIIRQRGHFLTEEESEKVAGVLYRSNGTMNPQIVGKTAKEVAALAGISIPSGIKVLVSVQSTVGKENVYSREKLTPVIGFYVEKDTQSAIDRCVELLLNEGKGHTASIHSNNEAVIQNFSLSVPVSRCLVNTPSALGAIGATTSLAPSMTLGCGAMGGSSTSDNVTISHLINVKKVVYNLEQAQEKTA